MYILASVSRFPLNFQVTFFNKVIDYKKEVVFWLLLTCTYFGSACNIWVY
jgi:hypothetical protein